MSISIADLEFENGRLVKVRGMRPEYAPGGQLIDMVRDLAVLVAQPPVTAAAQKAFSGTVDTDTPLMAAAREAGWALMDLVDGIYWAKRGQVCGIAARLAAALDAGEVEKEPEMVENSLGLPYPHPKVAPHPSAFNRGDFVRKKSGSWWEGRVVGFYSTEQTPDGVCVQLDKPNGPVQIYPAEALELSPAPVDELAVERDAIGAEARRYASHYPEASDGRNTFVIFAEWVEARGAKEKR